MSSCRFLNHLICFYLVYYEIYRLGRVYFEVLYTQHASKAQQSIQKFELCNGGHMYFVLLAFVF